MKGKHLMRSQALRETTSPPRTPSADARRPVATSVAVQSNQQQQQQHQLAISVSPNSLSPTPPTSTFSRHPSPRPQLSPTGCVSPSESQPVAPSFMDHEFPRLAQPKSKATRNGIASGINNKTISTTGESNFNKNLANTSDTLPSLCNSRETPFAGSGYAGQCTSVRFLRVVFAGQG